MTPGIVASDRGPAKGGDTIQPAEARIRDSGPAGPAAHRVSPATVAVVLSVVLLVLATTLEGAFAISRWAPLTLFVLAILIGAVLARGRLALSSPPIRAVLVGIWGLAGWSLLSMAWAQSSSDALTGAERMMLYAAIATVPFALPLSRRTLVAAAWTIAAGIGIVAAYTLIRLVVDGGPLFLAGRLNGPIDYRNGTALLFALPAWPLIVAASERGYRRVLRALALAIATLCLGLVFLTQSRGILIGLAAGACIALSLGPGRVRRAWMAVIALAGVAATSPLLLRPFHAWDAGHGIVSTHDITVAAWALTGLTAASFAVGMLISVLDQGLRSGSPQMRNAHRAARVALGGGIVVALVGSAIAIGNPASFARHKWDQFTNVNAGTPTSTRYASVGGQRYDLWRVAVKEFGHAPLLGVGPDNYAFDYYRYRATNRNLSDPHGLVFALLSENGLVGVLLFATYLGGIVATVSRGWRSLGRPARLHALGPLAAGAVLLGQSTVDWIWLIPGLTAIGVLALSLGAAQVAAANPAQPPIQGGSRRRIGRTAAGVGLLACAVGVLALFASNAYTDRARSAVSDPRAELSAAQTASSLNPWSVTPHYLEASAYETMGDRGAAYAQLRKALELEPENSSTLGVLGDLEARAGKLASARAYYRRALALNPLDTGLQALSRIGERARVAKRPPR